MEGFFFSPFLQPRLGCLLFFVAGCPGEDTGYIFSPFFIGLN
jgi:hypothetical protein